jgi:hypothetical protein
MSPKEKALELIDKYKWISYDLDDIENHKECALIAVDEIFKTGFLEGTTLGITKKYWQEVKQELDKM